MELKTKVYAEEGKQDLTITREFDLPVELLFKAYTEPEIVEQWMENKVLKLESEKHGSYQFEKKDAQGNVIFRANGVIHEYIPDLMITRTFEMEHAAFGVQLEFFEFEKLTEDTSKLNIHTLFKSAWHRDQLLQQPFEYGLSMAHDRLQERISKLK